MRDAAIEGLGWPLPYTPNALQSLSAQCPPKTEVAMTSEAERRAAGKEEKLEREMIGEFSQDSIFRELVDNRKSSASSRPIYQYGRKKKRRRGLE